MSRHYIYRMDIVDSDTFHGSYIGQHKIEKKDPLSDGYKGSGIRWKKQILRNHIPVKKTILRICKDIDETNYWEKYYIEQALQSGMYLWNAGKGGGGHESDKVYTEEEIRMHNKERLKRWYEANKERHAEYGRQYRKKNKERFKETKRRYEEKHKESYKNYRKEYYEKNKERLSEHKKQYYEQNKHLIAEKRRDYIRQYNLAHRKEIAEKSRLYYQAHREERRQRAHRPCFYKGKVISFGGLVAKLCREHVEKPSEVARKYLIMSEV